MHMQTLPELSSTVRQVMLQGTIAMCLSSAFEDGQSYQRSHLSRPEDSPKQAVALKAATQASEG